MKYFHGQHEGNGLGTKEIFQNIFDFLVRITPRFCKLSSLVFLCVFVSYIYRNNKDTTHPWGRRLETLYIDQNVSQPVKLNF